MAFTIAGFALGGVGALSGWWTAGKFLAGAMYGMSIASTIWSVTHQSNLNLDTTGDYSNEDSSKFDTITNEISNSAVIPVIYGTRKWGGLQVWHNPYNSQRNLQKDVLVCEGEIQGVYDVCANDDLIKSDTNISIYNTLYTDATVRYEASGKYGYLILEAGGITHKHYLQDVNANNTQTALLTTVIEKIRADDGDGWKIDGAVNDSSSKGINAKDIQFKNTSPQACYYNPDNPEQQTMVVLDNRGYSMGSYTVHDCETPSNYNDVGGYTNCCWIRADLIASARLSGGNPTISGIVKGRKVKVWHSDTATWTTEFSDNPAWCIRDFLTNKRFGCGYWITEDMIDDDSFKDVAAYCDELVSYVDSNGVTKQAKRWTLELVLDSAATPIDNLSKMLAIGGLFITINKKVALRVEREQDAVYDFTDDNIIKDSVSISQLALEETPNRYKVGYIDPSQNWTEIKVVCEDLEDQAERDGKIIEKTVSLDGCTSQQQALRVARLYRDLNKACSIYISFSVATQGMMLEAGDVVNVTYGGIFTKMPFRITEIDETSAGTYQLTCRQYNSTIYNDSLGATVSMPNYATSNSPYTKTPPMVDTVVATESVYSESGTMRIGIDVSWQPSMYKYLDHYKVSLSTDGATFKTIGTTFDTNYSINGLSMGTYYVCVEIVSNEGVIGSPFIAKATIAGTSVTPETPTNLAYTVDGTGGLWTWDYNKDNYTDYFELRLDNSPGTLNASLLDKTRDLKSRVVPNVRSATVYLYAKNIFGNYGTPATYVWSLPEATAPSKPTLTKGYDGVQIIMDALPSGCTGYKILIDNTDTYTTKSSPFTLFRTSGTVTVKYCFTDDAGDGLYSEEVTADIAKIDVTVSTDDIEAGAVTEEKIAANAVTAGKINAGAVTTEKLAANAVAANNINAGAVTTDKLDAKAVTAEKMSVDSLSAICATIGTLKTADSGARTVITDNLIQVYDSNNVLRVRIGVW